MDFILFVGANNTLANEEVAIQVPQSQSLGNNIFRFSCLSQDEAVEISSKLGSSIKLAMLIPNTSINEDNITSLIHTKQFSLTYLGSKDSVLPLAHKIKDSLPQSRFVLSKDVHGLSPVILKKHKVTELFLDSVTNEIWQTIWVHDFEHWIKKDRRMPKVDPRAGMLPPKIARSLINLVPIKPKDKLLMDPFCGSGRILIEAGELGFNLAGADIQAKQVSDTKENLQSFNLNADIKTADATHLSDYFQNIDLIVTEPFLGKPKFRPDEIKYIVPGLKKLYLGCLKNWLKILNQGGYIVMIFPVFDDGKKVYKTSEVIDGKLELGYNHVKRGIIYSRPEADVKREIVILQKK